MQKSSRSKAKAKQQTKGAKNGKKIKKDREEEKKLFTPAYDSSLVVAFLHFLTVPTICQHLIKFSSPLPHLALSLSGTLRPSHRLTLSAQIRLRVGFGGVTWLEKSNHGAWLAA
jgi:hypothetical protein